MIISFDHRFIFVKTHKTAGTSVEVALTPYCGPRDILTPLAPVGEAERVRDGTVQARNYAEDPALEQAFSRAVLQGDTKTAVQFLRSGRILRNHAPIRRARQLVPADFWADAFKFTIERHPYEKAVSGAYFRIATSGAPMSEFPRFLNSFVESMNDSWLYTINGNLAVDRVIRYENLFEEFCQVLGGLGLDPPEQLPHAKAQMRRDRRPAAEILTSLQKGMIFEQCRDVFERFGYEP
jgi:hypothetical protein